MEKLKYDSVCMVYYGYSDSDSTTISSTLLHPFPRIKYINQNLYTIYTCSIELNNNIGLAGKTKSKMLPSGSSNFLNGTLANRMNRRTFTNSPTVVESGTLSAGTSLLSVGDNLSATATQISDTYNSTSDLTVTVNFN